MNLRPDNATDEAEANWHRHLAAHVFGLTFDPDIPVRAERNVLSLVSQDVAFAQRLDCRTYFVQNQRYGSDRPSSIFRGRDEEQFAFCRTLFERLQIPVAEMAKQEVLREFGQSGQCDPQTRQVIALEAVQELGNFLLVSRQSGSVPVWSSHVKLGLTAVRQIGFLEFHWPVIPETVAREAERLAFKVSSGWNSPELAAAEVESVTAGIIHTPAVGYTIDIKAAVRVIYRPRDPRMGRKPMLHLDRHGEPVALRRTADLINEVVPGSRQAPLKN
jgi:hypothetical protein